MSFVTSKGPYRAAFGAMALALLMACSGQNGPNVGVEVSVKSAATTLESAMQADRDFAAAVAKDGPKAAFLAWFEPTESQFIDAGSVLKGAAAIVAPFEQSPPDFKLEWSPDGGSGSASGDFAATTGRYTVKMGTQMLAQGRYMTAWRKNAEGAWKVVMDATVADPAAPPTAPAGPTPDKPDFQGRPG